MIRCFYLFVHLLFAPAILTSVSGRKRKEQPFLLVVTTGGVSCCAGALRVRIQSKDGSQEVDAALLCRKQGFQEERCCSSPWFSEFRTTIIRLLEFPVFLSSLFPLSVLVSSNMGTFFFFSSWRNDTAI